MWFLDLEDNREVFVLLDIEGRQTHLPAPEDRRTMRHFALAVMGLFTTVMGLLATASLLG